MIQPRTVAGRPAGKVSPPGRPGGKFIWIIRLRPAAQACRAYKLTIIIDP